METNFIPIVPTFPFDDNFDVDQETKELLKGLLQDNFLDFRKFAQVRMTSRSTNSKHNYVNIDCGCDYTRCSKRCSYA
jgi:hypothetical protein